MGKKVIVYKNRTKENNYIYDVYIDGSWVFSRGNPDNVFNKLSEFENITISFVDEYGII